MYYALRPPEPVSIKNNHDRFPIGRKLSVLFTWCPDWSTRSVRECTPANDSSGQAPSSPSSGHRTNEQEPASCVRKTHLCLSHLALKMIDLPRQARDKQRERRLQKSTGRIVDCARHVDVAIRPARHADTLVKRPFLFCFALFLSLPSLSGQNDRFYDDQKMAPEKAFPKRRFPHLIVQQPIRIVETLRMRKNGPFLRYIYINEQFTKTGSGQI